MRNGSKIDFIFLFSLFDRSIISITKTPSPCQKIFTSCLSDLTESFTGVQLPKQHGILSSQQEHIKNEFFFMLFTFSHYFEQSLVPPFHMSRRDKRRQDLILFRQVRQKVNLTATKFHNIRYSISYLYNHVHT